MSNPTDKRETFEITAFYPKENSYMILIYNKDKIYTAIECNKDLDENYSDIMKLIKRSFKLIDEYKDDKL